MKKAILVFAIFGAICALGFSERFWHFESGARDLGGKVFGRISVINKTGVEIDVSGEPLEKNGKGLYFEDSILISCRFGDCDSCDAVYSIDGKHLQIVICPRGSYELDSKTYILPPIRVAHNPPPPPKHHKRYDHGPAPRKMDSHHSPRHHEPNARRRDSAPNRNGARPPKPEPPKDDSRPPRHHEPNAERRDHAPNKNGARPSKPESPKNDSRPPRPENPPRRPIKEKK